MRTLKIGNRLLTLCLGLTLLCLGSRAWQPAHGAAVAAPVPESLTAEDGQVIQTQVAILTVDDGADADRFGFSVSVSGDIPWLERYVQTLALARIRAQLTSFIATRADRTPGAKWLNLPPMMVPQRTTLAPCRWMETQWWLEHIKLMWVGTLTKVRYTSTTATKVELMLGGRWPS